jgi:YD repeat-containing protein
MTLRNAFFGMLLASTIGADSHAAVLTYDALGRVSSVTYDDGKMVSYVYDAAGNRTQHVVASGANLPPVAVDDGASLDVATSMSALIDAKANDTDPNNNPLTITSVTNGSHGFVTIESGGAMVQYTYTGLLPGQGTFVTDTFTYTISDANGGFDTGQVDVLIQDTSCPGICN